MLFWIPVILVILGVLVYIWDGKRDFFDADLDWIYISLCIVGGIWLVIASVLLIGNHINTNGQIRSFKVQYDSLVYQLENDIYDNDNDLGKKQLYEEIQDWNTDLIWYQEAQDDFWIGIFIPDIYDLFEFIELE